MTTVPRPLPYIPPSRTERDVNNHASILGFNRLPQPHKSPRVPGSSIPPSGSFVTTRVSPIAPVAEAGGNRIPIDPVLLAESQSQSPLHPPPSTGDHSKGRLGGIDIHTSGTLDSDSGNDSEDDRMDEFGVEYEPDGSDSDDGCQWEPVLSSHSKAHVRNSFLVNARD